MSKNFLKGTTLKNGTIIQPHNRIKIKIPNILKDKNIKQIWIIPKNKGHYFEIQYVYEINEINNQFINNENKYLSIDLGVNNLATCTYYNPYSISLKNKFKSFIIDGKKLKSINQFYNKQISKLQSLAAKDYKAPYYTKQMYNITRKRNNRINDYIHKTCKYIINYCLTNKINIIILGYNENIKQNLKTNNCFSIKHKYMTKAVKQNFVNIPFYRIKENLSYRCKLHNIKLIIQEESYTSKANFIKNDYIPTYGKVESTYVDIENSTLKKNVYDENKKYKFTGERINRGQYKYNCDLNLKLDYINADLNGSLNIMRKYLLNEEYKYLNKSKVVNIIKDFDIVKDFNDIVNDFNDIVNDFNDIVKDLNDILYHRGVLVTPIRIHLK